VGSAEPRLAPRGVLAAGSLATAAALVAVALVSVVVVVGGASLAGACGRPDVGAAGSAAGAAAGAANIGAGSGPGQPAPGASPAGEPRIGFTLRGYTSTFNDRSTASGVSAAGAVPGIAVPYLGSVGGYWLVTYPNRRRLVLRQIDTGPAPGLGPAPEHRVLDTDYAAAVRAGYTVADFPTDHGLVTAVYLGRDARWAALDGRVVGGGEPQPPSSGCAAPGPGAGAGPMTAAGYALPLERRYMTQLGRTDDGVDIETAPDGATVYSMTPGVCTAVASNPGGFGPSYPVIRATAGPLAGQHVYYGHVARALVQPGQRVTSGQPIAIMGHTGDAAGLGHGHIEIGFSDAGGNPLSHHGAEARTPSGARMRAFLIALAAAAGIRLS
jgi:murein DD-endopeptidase MepM/ murein hydrolase activator NlpD